MELKFLRVLIILFTRLIACVQDLLVLTDLLRRCAIWLAITCHNEAGTLYSFFFYLYGSNLVKQPWNAPTADSSGDVIHPDHICRFKMAIPLHVKARQAEYQGKVKRFPVPDEKVPWSVAWAEYSPVDYTVERDLSTPGQQDAQDAKGR